MFCNCGDQFSNLRVDCLLGPASVSCTHAFPAVWFSSVKVETRYFSTVRLCPQQSMNWFSVRFLIHLLLSQLLSVVATKFKSAYLFIYLFANKMPQHVARKVLRPWLEEWCVCGCGRMGEGVVQVTTRVEINAREKQNSVAKQNTTINNAHTPISCELHSTAFLAKV